MNQRLKYWNEQLSFAKGRNIVNAYMDVKTNVPYADELGVPVLVLDDGTRMLMLHDEEGNGPGSFDYDDPDHVMTGGY